MKVELLRGFLLIFVKSYHFILYNILCIYLAMFISNPASISCMYMCSSPIIRSQSGFQHLIDLHQQTEAGTGNRAFLSHDCTITKGVHMYPTLWAFGKAPRARATVFLCRWVGCTSGRLYQDWEGVRGVSSHRETIFACLKSFLSRQKMR